MPLSAVKSLLSSTRALAGSQAAQQRVNEPSAFAFSIGVRVIATAMAPAIASSLFIAVLPTGCRCTCSAGLQAVVPAVLVHGHFGLGGAPSSPGIVTDIV